MSRPLAPVLAAAVLALPAAARGTEPLDMDLSRLGAPDARVLLAMDKTGTLTPADAAQLANDAKVRFGILSSEMALAISSAVLHPASTTGHSGFDFDLEAAYVGVHPTVIGSGSTAATDWPTHALTPHELFLPAFHVRKALPFSFELGGRMIYLSQSSYFAAQVEGKWALNEGFDVLPDLAVRFAWTELFGQRDWDLGVGDVDLMVSKRWGVNAVTSFTPYAAARFSLVRASTTAIQFQPTPTVTEAMTTSASFPTLSTGFYRTTFGLRMTAYAVSMAAEATYFGGSKYSATSQYPSFRLNSSWGGAWKFGFEF